ncbi:MAG: 23S rRNA (adenine(2503)-C(2))-methyltransferase RlmN [Oscillospiraceae bacterium]|nr:23S rRNA (adenine(2503)-C(2))-methyltransferase RlmN [Oscillospiraceae bacterium]
MKQDLKSMNLAEMQEALRELGEPAFRAKQIFIWLSRGAVSFAGMTNLPGALREKLDAQYFITAPKAVRRLESRKDGTIKYLWELEDGNCVESVVMRYHHGNTVCISSEVGCPMGCAFCASTIGGLIRRLRPSELLDQVLFSSLDSGLPISNIVLMGIGEPLDNFDAVLRFLELVNSPDGMNIGMRHISLSTCGLVDKIGALAQQDLQLTLSVSLHAPDNETRNRIMPVNRRYPVETLLEACRKYYEKTGRRISFEYAMIRGMNDTGEQCGRLIRLLSGLPCHVNLIPLNEVAESPLKPSTRQTVAEFQKRLEDHGITATVRRTLGGDINASCGQLRRNYQAEEGGSAHDDARGNT